MAYIRVIGEEEAEGALKRHYDAARERAGKVYNVVKIFGMKPDTLRGSISLYRSVMFGDSGLGRAEREMIAVVTSQVNDCHY